MAIIATRRIERLADLYALTADILEDETGDLKWSAATELAGCVIAREESGLTITVINRSQKAICIHYADPGEAGDYLRRIGFGVAETWAGMDE